MRVVLLTALGSSLALTLAPKPRLVIVGPGASEVKLCAAKLAAKAGLETRVVVNDVSSARALMYGGGDGPARPIAGVEELTEALERCQALIVCCDNKSGPPTPGAIRGALDNAPKLVHVAMLSTMGGGKGNGPFAKSLAPGETQLRDDCASRGLPFSIVRVGVLKGGGPGEVATSGDNAGRALTDFGLSKAYYNTLVDLADATATMAYDRFTMGAKVTKGDPYQLPNFILAAATKGDFEPRDTDTSRVSAAGALVAAVRRPTPGVFTISAASAKAPPTADDWLRMLDDAAR